jgi:hypothetical protein
VGLTAVGLAIGGIRIDAAFDLSALVPEIQAENRSENFSDSLSLFLLHRPVPAVARWSYLVSTGVLRLLKGELPGDANAS